MAVAALVLSVVAILVAAASAWYTRRQAASAEGTRRIEAARRHDELAPVLVGEYVEASETREQQRPGMRLTNRGPLDLDRVEVGVIPVHRAAVIEGSTSEDRRDRRHAGDRDAPPRRVLDVRRAARPRRRRGPGRAGPRRHASFRCTCYVAGEEPWTAVVDVDFPASPWMW